MEMKEELEVANIDELKKLLELAACQSEQLKETCEKISNWEPEIIIQGI